MIDASEQIAALHVVDDALEWTLIISLAKPGVFAFNDQLSYQSITVA